uniref:PPIase cyclophilin-type domain-containing protein n=1 Tax=Rhabditophanes sp. KR3021 TaxID=114890 RepID=A0AC35TMX6_9BILA
MSLTLHTTAGDIKIELFCEKCPKACENFLALCASGYYDNNIFHRNIRGFIIQTGDPSGTGKGGKSIWQEPFEDELFPDIKHDKRGILSMANSGRNCNQSQFFITYAPHQTLDLKHTAFGKVIDGFEALEELENISVDSKHRPIMLRLNKFQRATYSTPIKDILLNQGTSISNYYDQYIEEYTEVDEQQVIPLHLQARTPKIIKQKAYIGSIEPYQIMNLLEKERALNIICIDVKDHTPTTDQIANQFAIICSPYNGKHAEALTETIRSHVKDNYSFENGLYPITTKNNSGWYIFNMRKIILHVLTEEMRVRYDLEGLYRNEDEMVEDDPFAVRPL